MGTYGTYNVPALLSFSVTNGELMVWIGEFYSSTTCSCGPIEVGFGSRSAILYGLLRPHCSQSSVRLPKPPVPPSTHHLHPTLGPCSCPHDPSPPPAVQVGHSHSSMHTTQLMCTWAWSMHPDNLARYHTLTNTLSATHTIHNHVVHRCWISLIAVQI